MKNTQSFENPAHKFAHLLIIVALVLWGVSLYLTGFMMNTRYIYSGLDILQAAILFGWNKVVWWPVYANVAFLLIVYKIYHRKRPRAYLFIILLFLGSINICSMITNNLNMSIDVPNYFPQSWGWGAILWLFTLSLATISGVLIHNKLSVKYACILIALLLAGMLPIAELTYSQRQKANAYELSQYFPKWDIAYTFMPLSGLSSKFLTENITAEATVEVIFHGEIEPLVVEDERLYPSAYWQNGKYWRKYQHSRGFKAISYEETSEMRQPSYRIEITHPKPEGYLYTLYDLQDNHVMYQQPFTKILNYWNKEELSPSPYSIPDEVRYIDYKER